MKQDKTEIEIAYGILFANRIWFVIDVWCYQGYAAWKIKPSYVDSTLSRFNNRYPVASLFQWIKCGHNPYPGIERLFFFRIKPVCLFTSYKIRYRLKTSLDWFSTLSIHYCCPTFNSEYPPKISKYTKSLCTILSKQFGLMHMYVCRSFVI